MMQIIPAIDIIEGKCVRLEQGLYHKKKTYFDDPVEVAKMFEEHGITRLHVVDLDGAKAKHIVNWRVLQKITNQTELIVDFGGGVKTNEDIKIAFEHGASMITVGSIAVQNQELFLEWLERFGAEKIILGADLKEGKVATHGWLQSSNWEWEPFLSNYIEAGIRKVLCTDVAKDGMMQGPAFALYSAMLKTFPDLFLIASGGVRNLDDLLQLQEMGCPAAIVGKAIYEQTIDLKDLEIFTKC